MPAVNVKRKHRGLSWELQEADGSVVLRGGEGYQTVSANRLEITTSDGGKLKILLREMRPGAVYIDVRDEIGSMRGAIEVQPRKGNFGLILFGDHGTSPNRVSVSARPSDKRRR